MNRRSIRLSIAIFLSVFAATTVADVLVAIDQLGYYEAGCVVFPENHEIFVNSYFPIEAQGDNPWFYKKQCDRIVSPEILNPVIEKLRLQEFGPVTIPAAYLRLRTQLSVRRLRNTGFIKISVRNQQRDLAIAIANAIADEYVRAEWESKHQRAARVLAMSQESLLDEQTRVAQLSQRVERLSQGLTGKMPQETSTDTNYDAMSPEMSQFMLDQEQRLYAAAKERIELARKLYSETVSPVHVTSRATVGSSSLLGPVLLLAIGHGAAVGAVLGALSALSVLAAKMVSSRRTQKQAA
jgi:uncharacterized protein involved in exopolysaccharide biosynthesis